MLDRGRKNYRKAVHIILYVTKMCTAFFFLCGDYLVFSDVEHSCLPDSPSLRENSYSITIIELQLLEWEVLCSSFRGAG